MPALRAHPGHAQLWLRSESDNSTSHRGLVFWLSRNCVQQVKGSPSAVTGMAGEEGMCGMEQSSGEPAGIAPHSSIQAVCEQQPQLTSALMSHLKFHVLKGAVGHLFLFSYIWIIGAPLFTLVCTQSRDWPLDHTSAASIICLWPYLM